MKLVVAYAERIKKLMQERNMTVEEFADKSKIPLREAKRLLDCPSKVHNFNVDRFLGVWRAFDMSLYEFFKDPLFNMDNLEDTRKI